MKKTTTTSNRQAKGTFSFLSSAYDVSVKEVVRIITEEVETGKGKKKKVEKVEKEVKDYVTTFEFKPIEIGIPANLKAETSDFYKEALKTLLETRVYADLQYMANTEEVTAKKAELKAALTAYAKQADVNKLLPLCFNSHDIEILDNITKVILGSAKDGKKHTWRNIDECEKTALPLLQAVANREEFDADELVAFKRAAEEFATYRLVSDFESQVFRKWDIDISTPVVNAIINNLYGKLKYRKNISGNTSVRTYMLGQQILLEVLKKTFKFEVPEEKVKEVVAD